MTVQNYVYMGNIVVFTSSFFLLYLRLSTCTCIYTVLYAMVHTVKNIKKCKKI